MFPERTPQITDKQLEWAARKAAGHALKPGDTLLDIEVGNLKRLRDNGIDRPAVTPKRWARAIPVTRGLMTVTYTREQILFLSDGLALNCALVRLHRAVLLDNRHQIFAFPGRDNQLITLEFEQASRRASAQPEEFLKRVIGFRDQERANLPEQARQLLERTDAIFQAQSAEDLWNRPPAPIGIDPADVGHLLGADAGRHDGIDDVTWNRLRLLVMTAHRRDAQAYADTVQWQPAGFGLPGQHRTGLYLKYLLNYRVREGLQTSKPSAQQLHDFAEISFPRVREILGRARQVHLEEALRTAFEMPPLATGITPGEFMVFAGAALGLLLGEPDRELAAMRPHLASWWGRHHDSFVRQGMKE